MRFRFRYWIKRTLTADFRSRIVETYIQPVLWSVLQEATGTRRHSTRRPRTCTSPLSKEKRVLISHFTSRPLLPMACSWKTLETRISSVWSWNVRAWLMLSLFLLVFLSLSQCLSVLLLAESLGCALTAVKCEILPWIICSLVDLCSEWVPSDWESKQLIKTSQ